MLFSPQIVSEVMEGLEGVVNNPEGTGYGACREDIRLAGKTGTAELKATKKKIHLEQKLAGLQFLLQIEIQRILFCSSVW